MELYQFKKQLLSKMELKGKAPKKGYDWVEGINFDFLPKSDCFYQNQHNLVLHGWHIFVKYVQPIATNNIHKKQRREPHKKTKQTTLLSPLLQSNYLNGSVHQSHIAIDQQIAFGIGQELESVYQHYQFLYSQKQYFIKYQQYQKNIRKKYDIVTPSKKKTKKTNRCYFNRYVSVGSFGSTDFGLYAEETKQDSGNDIYAITEEEGSFPSHSGSVSIRSLEVIEEKDGYQAIKECDEESEEYEEDDAYEMELPEESGLDIQFDIDPLVLDKNDEESVDDVKMDLILSDEEDEDEPILAKDGSSNKSYDVKDIWSVIEEATDSSKVETSAATLNVLFGVFDSAEYMVWDQLLVCHKKY